jgi:single-strand DNA-binding protein
VSINRAILLGNVGRDPEVKSLQNGDKVASFSLATSETWRDKATGERREATEWHQVVVFNQALVGVVEGHVKKGGRVSVEGAIKTRKWQDKDGKDRFSTEIVVGRFDGRIGLEGQPTGGPDRSEESYGTRSSRPSSSPSSSSPAGARPAQDLDDEIPF